jgi:hypothetical protein
MEWLGRAQAETGVNPKYFGLSTRAIEERKAKQRAAAERKVYTPFAVSRSATPADCFSAMFYDASSWRERNPLRKSRQPRDRRATNVAEDRGTHLRYRPEKRGTLASCAGARRVVPHVPRREEGCRPTFGRRSGRTQVRGERHGVAREGSSRNGSRPDVFGLSTERSKNEKLSSGRLL